MSQTENDLLNQIKRQLQKKSNRPQYFPLFTKFELNLLKSLENKKNGFKTEDLQVYKLHSFASPKFSFFDVYQLYFPSIVSNRRVNKESIEYSAFSPKNKEKKDKREFLQQKSQISQFFSQLIEIVLLRSLQFSKQSNLARTKILLIDQVQNAKLEQSLQAHLNNQIQKQYLNVQDKLNLKEKSNRINFQTCKKIFKLLQQSKLNCENQLYLSDQTSILFNQKHLFPNLLDLNLQNKKYYLASSLYKLYRIPAFFPEHKQKIIKSFISNYKTYSSMVYSTIQPDYLVQIKKQKQKEPVLIGILHYLNLSKNPKIRDKITKRYPLFLDVASFLIKRKILIPSLNVQSILFNQKSLKPDLSQIHLLTAGLGLNGDIGSVQHKLCSNPTPKPIEFEQCHLEREEQNLWFLDMRLFDIFQSQQDRLQMEQISKTKQKIYVWRIICVLFYILNSSKHMTCSKYHQKYGNNNNQEHNVPFNAERYWKLCKEIYEEFRQKPINIRKTLLIQGDQDLQLQTFEYSREELKRILKLQSQVKKQSNQIYPKDYEIEVRNFRQTLSNCLRNQMQTDTLYRKLNILHSNILVLLAFYLDQTFNFNQSIQLPVKYQKFLQKLEFQTKKVTLQISANKKQCGDCNFCTILQKCNSLIALHKNHFNFQQWIEQITSLSLDGFLQLINIEKTKQKLEEKLLTAKKFISKEVSQKQHQDLPNISNKRKGQQMQARTIVLLVRTLKVMNESNIKKLITFVIPFLTLLPKKTQEHTNQQWEQRKIRLAVATEIIESEQQQQIENALMN